MITATHRDREFAHARSHYAWSEDEATQHFAEYREEVLAAIEASLPGDGSWCDGDEGAVRQCIAKLRGAR